MGSTRPRASTLSRCEPTRSPCVSRLGRRERSASNHSFQICFEIQLRDYTCVVVVRSIARGRSLGMIIHDERLISGVPRDVPPFCRESSSGGALFSLRFYKRRLVPPFSPHLPPPPPWNLGQPPPHSNHVPFIRPIVYLMYWDTQRNPSPYPMRLTTEHMNTSIGLMLVASRLTFPLPVV